MHGLASAYLIVLFASSPDAATLKAFPPATNIVSEVGGLVLLDPATGQYVENPQPGDSLIPVGYFTSTFDNGLPQIFFELELFWNGAPACMTGGLGPPLIRVYSCPDPVIVQAGINTLSAEFFWQETVAGGIESASRTFDTNVQSTVDHALTDIRLLTEEGSVVTEPRVGQRLVPEVDYTIVQTPVSLREIRMTLNGQSLCTSLAAPAPTAGPVSGTMSCGQIVAVEGVPIVVEAVIDPDDLFMESDESNNALSAGLPVPISPPTVAVPALGRIGLNALLVLLVIAAGHWFRQQQTGTVD